MTRACSRPRWRCAWIAGRDSPLPRPRSRHGVWPIENWRPRHSAIPYSRSRVRPDCGSTIALRQPRTRLKSVDLPTLGRPTIATIGLDMGSIRPALAPVALPPVVESGSVRGLEPALASPHRPRDRAPPMRHLRLRARADGLGGRSHGRSARPLPPLPRGHDFDAEAETRNPATVLAGSADFERLGAKRTAVLFSNERVGVDRLAFRDRDDHVHIARPRPLGVEPRRLGGMVGMAVVVAEDVEAPGVHLALDADVAPRN